MSELDSLVSQLAELSAQPAAEPDDGLNSAEWHALFEAEQLVRTACETAAGRRLRKRLPAVQRRLGEAEDAYETAKRNAKAPENAVRKLEQELAEAQRRLAACELAGDDDDLTVRVESRLVRSALADECDALTGRLARIREMTAPHIAERARAESERDAAKRELAELTAALADPFGSRLGRSTPEFERFIKYAGAWEEYPHTDATRKVLTAALGFTGLRDVLLREWVTGWLDEDPEIRKASGILQDENGLRVVRTPEGQIITLNMPHRERYAGQHAEPQRFPADARAALVETFGVGVVPAENDPNPAMIGRRW